MLKKVITKDQSESYLNEEVGESYHSHAGAVEEALKKYAIPCKIRELAKTGEITILDMFFGLGYNSAMAISEALAENPDCVIKVYGLENDERIIANIQEVNPNILYYKNYKELNKDNLEINHNNVKVKILLGDARETVKQLQDDHFDAVFFDPFSPGTAPEMWQPELFKEMFRVMKNSAILATYSCARMARENMSKAGLFYDDGPIVGRRGPGTIAKKWI